MMLHRMRVRTTLLLLTAAGAWLSTGCASKKALREGLSAQGTKIADIETQVEATQRRIDGVEGQAVDARRIGTDAGVQAGQARDRADQAFGLAKGKLLYSVVLSETGGHFAFDKFVLSDEACASLDDLAARLKADNANVYLEIQGHTDATGPDEYNITLGQRRAEEVRRYLNVTHGIPLHKMSVVSFGEAQPIADNGSRDGRAQNRRVEVRVLS